MKLIIHRGTHEIGGTCVELATKNTRIIIDVGIPFDLPSGEEIRLEDMYKLTPEELLAKGVAKDVPGLYSWDTARTPPDAILITHPHPDHFGLLPFVKPSIPLYMSRGAHLMIDKVSNLFNRITQDLGEVKTLTSREWIAIGDFKIKPFLVDHAGLDARGFLIEAEGKRLYYTGDFRGHGKKSIVFDNMIEHPFENLDYLITEGTCIEGREGPYKTETDVENAVVDVLNETKGIVFINFSSQNIDRIVSIYNACARAKRTFVIDPMTAHVLNIAKELSKKIPHARFDPAGIFRIFYAQSTHTDIMKENDLLYGFPAKVKIEYEEIGEKAGSIAVRDTYFIRERFKKKEFLCDSVLIFSQYEGYLEDNEAFWRDLGIPIKQIHVSGHATIEELDKIIASQNPGRIIPMHTPAPEKFAERYGDKVMRINDGEVVEL